MRIMFYLLGTGLIMFVGVLMAAVRAVNADALRRQRGGR